MNKRNKNQEKNKGDGQSCENPLLLKWLEEMYNESRIRNLKTQYNLAKAVKSLKAYPIPFTNPLETVQLEGIGAATAEKLKKKWDEHVISNPSANVPTNIDQSESNSNLQSNNNNAETISSRTSSFSNNSISQQKEPETNNSKTLEKANSSIKTRKRQEKEYTPRYQSGAFGLLVGLYKGAIKYGIDYYIPKHELIILSQYYCSSPLDIANISGTGGRNPMSSSGNIKSSWFTGIRTLEKKEYVWKQGASAKYRIDEKGIKVAQKIVRVMLNSNQSSINDHNHNSDEICIDIPQDDVTLFKKGESMFDYSDTPTNSNMSNSQQNISHISNSQASNNSVYNTIENAGNKSTKNSNNIRIRSHSINSDSSRDTELYSQIDLDDDYLRDGMELNNITDLDGINQNSRIGSQLSQDSIYTNDGEYFSSNNGIDYNENIIYLEENDETVSGSSNSRDVGDREVVEEGIDIEISKALGEILSEPIVYEAGSYEIVLLVDVREIKSNLDREKMMNGLLQKSIKAETAVLPVGDYLWVARPKPKRNSVENTIYYNRTTDTSARNIPTLANNNNIEILETSSLCGEDREGSVGAEIITREFDWDKVPNTDGATAQNSQQEINSGGKYDTRDIVLNMVIERKRMSDLCSSIVDGRISEQKVIFY
ncbi:hypothetical protein BB559_005057 [Furculomyces boomerangus]|uniref:Crossover junction endonuclease MUS81 n=1 Tax=Furculomyces boomerangus TaxID=61424 RepID=A0A2T9YB35_9FUNG|nr:hypothetical protein BB559_005057 [Furculomyces boomerangus]